MKTKSNKTSYQVNFDDVKFENPLGLYFDVPKAEENLRSSTIHEGPKKAKNVGPEKRYEEFGSVSPWGSGSFSISQVLG